MAIVVPAVTARIRDIVIDALHPASLARFWAATLAGYQVRAYEQVEIDRLASEGFTPETDPSVAVDGPGPTLFFQKIFQKLDSAHRERNRMHLDIVGTARSEEVERLCELGASVRDTRDSYTVMLDPEGNSFCVKDPD
jgi:hypothetical protein